MNAAMEMSEIRAVVSIMETFTEVEEGGILRGIGGTAGANVSVGAMVSCFLMVLVFIYPLDYE